MARLDIRHTSSSRRRQALKLACIAMSVLIGPYSIVIEYAAHE
jgi:hypothetical protein